MWCRTKGFGRCDSRAMKVDSVYVQCATKRTKDVKYKQQSDAVYANELWWIN